MKAVLCKEWGPPESLVVEDVPDPQPAPGQVAIDIHAAGVNFPDVLIIQNKYQFKPPLPFTPGSELSGVVRAVGAGVTRFKAGDRVIAYVGQGAFAEQICTPEHLVMPMPPGMDFDVAAHPGVAGQGKQGIGAQTGILDRRNQGGGTRQITPQAASPHRDPQDFVMRQGSAVGHVFVLDRHPGDQLQGAVEAPQFGQGNGDLH